jgi:hypothetical protein
MMLIRLYADDDGESHFDTQEIAMTLQEFAPPAAPLYVSEARPASRFVVIQLPVAWGGGEPHPTPSRHVLLCLSGSFQIRSSDGETRSFSMGDALLMVDTKGKGHSTTVTSDKPVTAVMIRLE